jgi:crotonobetainyl-CoA:carnitine CoA-transferase CaiB-like acyl-CoA transferase
MASGPLDGIRILEFTQIIAGPFGCQNLSDMGAEVIKVEPPDGEPWRQFNQFVPGESKWFQTLNRGKRSLVLAMQEPEAQAIVHKLIPDTDVVVINYRPDVAARLGIDYQTLSAIRDDLIYVDNTAFGREGPWAERPGYDIIAQAVSGLMVTDGKFDKETGAPQIMNPPVADYGTGLAIAWGVCAALYHRERTGEGQVVESTLLSTALSFQGSVVAEVPAADALTVEKMANVHQLQTDGASYPDLLAAYNPYAAFSVANIYYRTFQTKDGAVAVGALSPGLFEKVRAALGTDFMGMADPEMNPMDPAWFENARTRVAEIEESVKEKTSEEWLAIFAEHGVPSGPINFPEDMAHDAQVEANAMVTDIEHDTTGPQRQVGPLLKMSQTPLAAQGSSPPLGRDTDDIVGGAGYTAEEIADLRERGIIA